MRLKAVSGIILTLLVIGMLTLTFNIEPVKASGTIYIKADGSVDPPSAPIQRDGDVYTFTDNIYDEIVVERDDIVVDGAGYSLQGTGSGYGISLSDRSNVTIKNMQVKAFGYAISLSSSSDSNVTGNNLTNNQLGIWIGHSSNNTIYGNNITANYDQGIFLYYSPKNALFGNNITANGDTGVELHGSSNNTLFGNNLRANYDGGFELRGSSNNTLFGNTIRDHYYGIFMSSASNNIFYHNNFISNDRPAVLISGQSNLWDNGYPSGGNYWSNYRSTDLFSGPYQNITGCDGIGDTPYAEFGVLDNYPLIFPVNSPPTSPVAVFSVWSPSMPMRAGEALTFDASFSLPGWNATHAMPITEYRWDFGDGNTTSTVDLSVAHTYSHAKTYSVKLTVVDSEGLNSFYSKAVKVWMPTFISISTGSSSTFVGFAVDINGALYDIHGDGLENQTVVLFYTFSGANTWVPITSDTTDHLGNYYVKWIPPATGYFTIKAEWTGNSTHFGANNAVSLSSIPYQNKYVFSVESNSTVSSLAFNTTNRTLSFTVSGPSGTKGYVKVTVAKSLVENIADVKVYLDGNQLNYTVTSLDDSWLLHFTYLHSTHKVTISLSAISTPFIETPLGKVVLYGIPITAMVILIVLYVLKKKQRARVFEGSGNLYEPVKNAK